MRITPRLIPAALSLLALAACGDGKGYPSLARRDVEKSPNAAPAPAPAPLPSPESASLGPQLQALVAQARAAHEKFASRRPRAQQLAAGAGGAAMASETWSVASVALAELESSRSDAMIALADLDQLYAARRIDGGDGASIAAARDQVMAWIGEEDEVLAALRSRLGS